MNTKVLKLNEFYLRIIAIITMTFDHVGIFLLMYIDQMGGIILGNEFSNPVYTIAFIFRCIGRIAMPLYIFMIVEGVKHTRNFWKYFMKIGILAAIVMLTQILIYYLVDTSIETAFSPYIDLVMIALMVYLLKRRDKYSYLSLLPIGYLLLSYIIFVFENQTLNSVLWFPFYLRASYSLFGLILGLGFYFANILSYKSIAKQTAINDREIIEGYPEFRALTNIFSIFAVIIAGIFVFLTNYIRVDDVPIFDTMGANIQSYCFLAIIPLYFYSGLRGYNKTWFKYFSYLYYPVHIVILFVIFYVIFR